MKSIKTHTWKTALPCDAAAFVVLATAGLALGLIGNQLRDTPLSLTYRSKAERLEKAVNQLGKDTSTATVVPVASVPTKEKGEGAPALPAELSMDQFRAFVEERQGLVLDARPEIFHRIGHVPGALSLPRDDFENAYPLVRSRLEADKAQPLVLYCSGSSCEDSHLVKAALLKLGYTHVSIFTGGWSEWTKAGMKEETNP